jgi:hypothetical protein
VNTAQLILIIPLALIAIGLLVYALYDLSRPERKVRGGNKWIWLAVILLISTAGPLAYLLVGREEA